MRYKTTIYLRGDVWRTREWSTKKEAEEYKLGIKRGFTVRQRVKESIHISIDKL